MRGNIVAAKRDRPGEYVGFRASPALKKKLERAAKAAGRSLSTETQMRLEQSFRDDRMLAAVNDFDDRVIAAIENLTEIVVSDGDSIAEEWDAKVACGWHPTKGWLPGSEEKWDRAIASGWTPMLGWPPEQN